AQLPVPDPLPLAHRIAGLPVLDQVGLRLAHIVVRGVPIPQERRAGRFEPRPQSLGAQHPHLMTPRDRPAHHSLTRFHTTAAIPASHQDLHPPHLVQLRPPRRIPQPTSQSRPPYGPRATPDAIPATALPGSASHPAVAIKV